MPDRNFYGGVLVTEVGTELGILDSLGNRTKIYKFGGTLEGPEGGNGWALYISLDPEATPISQEQLWEDGNGTQYPTFTPIKCFYF